MGGEILQRLLSTADVLFQSTTIFRCNAAYPETLRAKYPHLFTAVSRIWFHWSKAEQPVTTFSLKPKQGVMSLLGEPGGAHADSDPIR